MNKMENDETDITSRVFHLACRVGQITQGFNHSVTGKQVENTSIVLVPGESDERTAFLSAWLPGASGDAEIIVDLAAPIDIRGRVSLQRPGLKCPSYHLFVMSHALKDRLTSRLGTVIHLTTLPQDDRQAQEKDY